MIFKNFDPILAKNKNQFSFLQINGFNDFDNICFKNKSFDSFPVFLGIE